jgi:hypothetical protein
MSTAGRFVSVAVSILSVRYYDHIKQVKAGAARALKRPPPPPADLGSRLTQRLQYRAVTLDHFCTPTNSHEIAPEKVVTLSCNPVVGFGSFRDFA